MVSAKHKQYNDNALFGGNREVAIQRDGERCVNCGMTRQQHKDRFGRDITVDHIDRRGSNVPKHMKNNALSNLQTLCAPCHSRKDSVTLRMTDMQVINIRHCEGSVAHKELALLYGVDTSYISKIMRNRWRTNLENNIDTSKMLRKRSIKKFCPRGHDRTAPGAISKGWNCVECRRILQRSKKRIRTKKQINKGVEL
jgi:hypothetical protein